MSGARTVKDSSGWAVFQRPVLYSQAVSGMTGVTAVAAGNDFSLIVKDGKVFAAGDNSRYQLTESTIDGSTGDPVDSSSTFVQIICRETLQLLLLRLAAGIALCLAVTATCIPWGFNFAGRPGLAPQL